MNKVFFSIKQFNEFKDKYPSKFIEEFVASSSPEGEGYAINLQQLKTLQDKYSSPSLGTMVSGLVEAGKIAIEHGFKKRSREEIRNCLNVCNKCDWLVKNTMRCGKCGCFLKIKTVLQNWKCPLNKW
jgi:hypothetical protein